MTKTKFIFFILSIIALVLVVSCQDQDNPDLIAGEVRSTLAEQLDIDINQISVRGIEQNDWPDDCLGVGEPGEVCAQMITPGYKISLNAEGTLYEFRSTLDGAIIKLISPIENAATGQESALSELVSSPTPMNVGVDTGGVVIIGGDEGSLREFISRWFAPLYLYPGSPEGNTIIRIGEMPEELNYDIPIPDGANIIASISQPFLELKLILNVPMTPADVKAFYEQALIVSGWSKLTVANHEGGFISTYDAGDTYCRDDNQVALMVQTFETSQETDLRLTLYSSDTKYMCNPGSQETDQAFGIIPVLEMPAEAVMISGSSGSSSDGAAEISADIQTELSTVKLGEHFMLQLTEQDWRMMSQGSADVLSWSTWEKNDDQNSLWVGTGWCSNSRLHKIGPMR